MLSFIRCSVHWLYPHIGGVWMSSEFAGLGENLEAHPFTGDGIGGQAVSCPRSNEPED